MLKTPAIILAAGASRRLGMPKQLVEMNGEALIRRAARIARMVCEPVLVVTGCVDGDVREALRGLDILCIHNLEWEEGMASSVRAGLSALPADARAALFMVCDQPALDEGVLQRILEQHALHPDHLVASFYDGHRGIPSLFPRRCFEGMLRLRGDQGGRKLLQGDRVVEIPFPGGAQDLDHPEQLAQLQSS